MPFNRRIDAIFICFLIVMGLYYNYYISQMKVPLWDGSVYLENAKRWLHNEPLYQAYRPQLTSLLIAGIWSITGEDWTYAKYIQASFTLASGIVLYLTLRKHKGALFALGVSVMTMLNAQVFMWSTQILVEGVSLFFLTLTLYLLKSKNPNHWFLAGISIGLTFASRYPIIVPALPIFIAEAVFVRRSFKHISRALIGLVPTLFLMVLAILLKTGTFITALSQDAKLSIILSPFYIEHAFDIWGLAILLLPVAFLFKRTFSDRFNYSFIAWFAISLLFWSANVSNHQERFMFQTIPAAYFLVMLAIENIWKDGLRFSKPLLLLSSKRKESPKQAI